jgi:hypothetical protein
MNHFVKHSQYCFLIDRTDSLHEIIEFYIGGRNLTDILEVLLLRNS